MRSVRGNKDYVVFLDMGEYSIRYKKPLAFLANSYFISVMVMEGGYFLRERKAYRRFVIIESMIGRNGERGEADLI